MSMPKPKLRPLSALKNKLKGPLHHVEIHPAKNSDGSQAFLSQIHRGRTPQAQAAMDAGGPYTPAPPPEETQHPDGQDMMQHVGKALGVKMPPPEPDEDDQLEGNTGDE